MYDKKKCIVDGCLSMRRNKGLIDGKRFYGNLCDYHHRSHRDNDMARHIKQRIPNIECEVCGWNKAFCDRHRLNPKLGYTQENIKVLCPNCHRLATIGLLKFADS